MASKGAKEPPLPRELQAQLDTLTRQRWSADDADSATQLTTLLSEWKCLGNACYGNGCFLAAIRCYTKLLELPGGDTAQARSNRSAAYLQSPMHAGPALALKDAERAVELEPRWFKSHLRVGDAQRLRGKVMEADAAYRRALELQPTCASAQAGLRALEEHLQYATEEEARATASPTTGGAAAGPSAATSSHSSAQPRTSEKEGKIEEPQLTQEQLIHSWKRDTSVREDRTAMRPAPVSLTEADRQQGPAFKEAMLSRFRSKVGTNEALSDTLRERREEALLQGDGVNYREADKYRRVYAHATDGIGLGISADAYKEYTGKDDRRAW